MVDLLGVHHRVLTNGGMRVEDISVSEGLNR